MSKIVKSRIEPDMGLTKREIKSALKELMTSSKNKLIVSNYNSEEEDYEEGKIFSSDMEITIWNDGDYVDVLTVQSFEIKNNEYDFYELVEYFDKYLEKKKKSLYEWLCNNYYDVELTKGYYC